MSPTCGYERYPENGGIDGILSGDMPLLRWGLGLGGS